MSKDRIGVVYLTDGNRDDLTYASAVALGMHHQREIDIHVVQANFNAAPRRSVLSYLQSRGHRLAVHSISIRDRQLQGFQHITPTAYAKVEAIAAISQEHQLLCYVDNDTLTLKPIDLMKAMPSRTAIAAVSDLSVATGFDNPAFFDNCKKHSLEQRYFNSGFFTINVPRWECAGILASYEAIVKAHDRFCPYFDGGRCGNVEQCALNMASQGQWEELPVEYNVQKSAFQTRYWTNAKIRHYTGPDKFLPSLPHRADAVERRLLGRIARSCPDIGVRVPPGYLGLPYWTNGLRRTAVRTRISQLINQHCAASGGLGA